MVAQFCPLHARYIMSTCNIFMLTCGLFMSTCNIPTMTCSIIMSTFETIMLTCNLNYVACQHKYVACFDILNKSRDNMIIIFCMLSIYLACKVGSMLPQLSTSKQKIKSLFTITIDVSNYEWVCTCIERYSCAK